MYNHFPVKYDSFPSRTRRQITRKFTKRPNHFPLRHSFPMNETKQSNNFGECVSRFSIEEDEQETNLENSVGSSIGFEMAMFHQLEAERELKKCESLIRKDYKNLKGDSMG